MPARSPALVLRTELHPVLNETTAAIAQKREAMQTMEDDPDPGKKPEL
jgi:hypothetical protein